jgi:hypothetical protein
MITGPGIENQMNFEPAYLQSIIHRNKPYHSCELLSWNCIPLGKNKEESSVFRVFCNVLNHKEKRVYALILKILKPDALRKESHHYYYWKREALVYQSGILNQLPAGIRAPECYAVEEKQNGDIWIWLEDINIENLQSDWSLHQMKKVSYLLGKFNGRYLSGTPLPAHSFLCRNWLKSWVNACTAYAKPIQVQKAIWDCYRNVIGHTSPAADIWNEYCLNRTRVNNLLETLDRLPRVFAHQDVHWDNIFIEQVEERHSIIAMDWQFASISGVGEELGRMFGYALLKGKIPVEMVEEYKESLFKNYLQGIRDSGWNGNANLPRFGFCAAAGSRFIMAFDKLLTALETGDGNSQKEKLSHLLLVVQALIDLAEESWNIRSQIT